jgi:F-type H+-transporting ATPase subunit delta
MAETIKHPTVLDSVQQHLGDVYAKALLGASEKAGNTDQVLEEFDSFIDEVLDRLPRLDATLASPRTPLEAKLAMLDKAIGGKVSVTLLNFLKVVCKHRRFEVVRAMRRAAHELYNEMTGSVDVRIRTAAPLSDQLCERVASRLEAVLGQKVNLAAETDAGVIGGIVVRVGDTVYDGSVAGSLDRLRDEAVQKTSRAVLESLERFEVAGES